jgi:hypothetical protein
MNLNTHILSLSLSSAGGGGFPARRQRACASHDSLRAALANVSLLLALVAAGSASAQVIIKDTVIISPGLTPASPESQLIWYTPEWGRLRVWWCQYSNNNPLCVHNNPNRKVLLESPVWQEIECQCDLNASWCPCGQPSQGYFGRWEPTRGWPAGTPVSVLVDSYGIRYPDSITVGSYPGTIIRAKFWFTVGPSHHWVDVDLLTGPTCSPPTVAITHPAQDTTIVLSVSNQPTITFQETHTPAGGDCEPIISWEPGYVLETSQYWNQIADSIQIPVIVTARNQHTARDTVVVTLKVEPSVEIIPPGRYVIDGDTSLPYELQISPPGVFGTSFLWRGDPLNIPAGNDPEVEFLPDPYQQNVSIANAKWYAFPDDPCSCMVLSSYLLKSSTSINGRLDSAFAILIVRVPDPGGVTDRPKLLDFIEYDPVIDANGDTIKWVVSSTSNIVRLVLPPLIFVDSSSQFYHKVAAHENVHYEQYTSGMASDLFSADTLWNRISVLEAPTEQELRREVTNKKQEYEEDERKKLATRLRDLEIQAYDVSDPIPPMYYHQRQCSKYRDE